MNRYFNLWFLVVISTCLTFAQPTALTSTPNRGRIAQPQGTATHTLFGDLKIDERKVSGAKPRSYQVILYTTTGGTFGRASVSPNGRYYFHNVPNGDYYLVVELEGVEIIRMNLRFDSLYKTEFRHDLELEWRENSVSGKGANPGTISADIHYSRSPANHKLFEKAQDAIARKDYQQAVSLLNQLVSVDAKDYQAWTTLGSVYFNLDKVAEAEKAFRRALEIKPDLRLALLSLGKSQMAQKKYESAIETLTKTVEVDPKSPEANLLLGEAYLQIKKGSKAVGYLNEAIKLDPIGMAEAHLRLGMLYRAAGLKDKAVVEFEQFLLKRPDYQDKEKLRQYISENRR